MGKYENEQYEMVWRSGKKYFCRTRNVHTNEVKIENIWPEHEYFIQDQNGDYTYILDQDVKLRKFTFTKPSEAYQFRQFNESVGRTIYGGQAPEYKYIRDHFFETGKDTKSRVWFFDIEVVPNSKVFPDPQKADHPITQIQIYDNYADKIILLSLTDFKDKSRMKKYENLVFKKFDEEKDLLKAFLVLLEKMKPTILTGWNIDYFDVPYITHRIMNFEGISHLRLSPISVVTSIETKDGYNYRWEGLYLIDMMQAYKKFVFTPQPSYSLEAIAKVELGVGEGKVDYGEFSDIIDFYHGDQDKFLEYAIQDVIVLKSLEDKLKLLELMKLLAYTMGVNFDDTFGTVKPWGMYIINLAMKEKMVTPYRAKGRLDHSIVGGYVRHPKKGISEWIVSIDVDSMYPLLGMRAFNMSPETYINEKDMHEELLNLRRKLHRTEDESLYQDQNLLEEIKEIVHKHDVAYGMNAFFKRDHEGIIPRTVGKIYADRKEAKRKKLVLNALKAKLKASH